MFINSNYPCAYETLADAMVTFGQAKNFEDAYEQIKSHPDEDLAGIETCVYTGLTSCAEQIGCSVEQLISEKDLSPLADLSALQIVKAIDAIHKQWIRDNFTPAMWVQKYFTGQLGQFRKMSRIPLYEAAKDLLFIQEYLLAGGNAIPLEEVEEAFVEYSKNDSGDEDIPLIEETVYGFKNVIVREIRNFREDKEAKNDTEMVERVNNLFRKTTNPEEILNEMLCVI